MSEKSPSASTLFSGQDTIQPEITHTVFMTEQTVRGAAEQLGDQLLSQDQTPLVDELKIAEVDLQSGPTYKKHYEKEDV